MTSQEARRAQDTVQIHQVLARYSRGIDRMDRSIILSVYWEDAYDRHAVFEGGPSAFADWVAANMSHYRASSHMLGQSLIEVVGDEARVETYFTAFHHAPGDDGDVMLLVAGRYLDAFQRRRADWRIHRREVLIDWVQKSPMGDGLAELKLIHPIDAVGHRDHQDRSYRLFAFEPT